MIKSKKGNLFGLDRCTPTGVLVNQIMQGMRIAWKLLLERVMEELTMGDGMTTNVDKKDLSSVKTKVGFAFIFLQFP